MSSLHHDNVGHFRKIVATTLSTDFRKATTIVDVSMKEMRALKKNELLVRNRWAGINASDVNWTAGRYFPDMKPPFDCGFEAVGVIVAVGSNVTAFRVGQPVLTSSYGAFSEYQVVSVRAILPLPSLEAEYLPLRVNALTALAALEEKAKPKQGEIALVTAAAGGTGQFAVQLLKHYGCHVIGTCSTAQKASFLRAIGCDRIVDYKKEDLASVLRSEYPKGVDIVFESVGGKMFDAAMKNIAINGRVVTIGAIESYMVNPPMSSFDKAPAPAKKNAPTPFQTNRLNMFLISRSASISGFLLTHLSPEKTSKYLSMLLRKYNEGTLKSAVDPKPFRSLEQVADAVEYLHSGDSIGKVVVSLEDSPSKL